MSKKQTKTEMAIAYREDACLHASDPRPSSSLLAEECTLKADELMAVNPSTLNVESGEVTCDPDSRATVDTLVSSPDRAAVEASLARTDALAGIDCTGMGLDAANSIKATDSMEKMLVHQMSAAHKLAFDLLQESVDLNQGRDPDKASIIQSRKVNSANRLMQTFQQGLVALNKYRAGGKQVMVVQHVNVNDGGQAIVTGLGDEKE